jgi:glutamyl-tRNA synthetase
VADGRFAPSPTGRLHLGNLRTALLAWLFARSSGGRFRVRMEDLDAGSVRVEHYDGQLDDLRALGLDWDGPVVRQSERRDVYDAAIAQLVDLDLTYRCYCTRREIQEAASAAHGDPMPEGAYPGTCRTLTASEQAEREGAGRRPALRLRAAAGLVVSCVDRLHGRMSAVVDDVVLRRGDGTPAYNLAVVVDDAAQGVDEVVRGDDLLLSTPRQVHLASLLGVAVPSHAHVPLVLGVDGARLAKRHGAVTLGDRGALGETPDDVRSLLAWSVGLASPGERVSMSTLLARFDPDALPREPWVFSEIG